MWNLWKKTKKVQPQRTLQKPLGDSLSKIINSPFSQKNSHRINLIFTFCLVAGTFIFFHFAGLLASNKNPILPGEIILAGAWKLSLEDNPRFSSPKFNDSLWCNSGVPDPMLWQPNNKNLSCPQNYYPIKKMRENTYWYRVWVNIPPNTAWKNPSLFLGAIKDKAWIYWDGELVGINSINNGTVIVAVPLEKTQTTPGKHLLAVRTKSGNTRYPGIFHAYPRKVTLGEAENNNSQFKKIISEKYVYPSLAMFVQCSGLVITLILLSFGKGSGSSLIWLSLYFFSTTLSSLSTFSFSGLELGQSFKRISIAMISISIFGFSLKFHPSINKIYHIISRILVGALILSLSIYAYFLSTENMFGSTSRQLTLTIALVPFVAFFASLSWEMHHFLLGKKVARPPLVDIFSLTILGSLHTLNVLSEFLLLNTPHVFDHPAIKASLSVALIATMIYQYTQQERTLAFFGRFIRPGLKNLLKEEIQKSEYSDKKIFRPRQIAIMKIDIVAHTETTYQMPYGIKRLYQDTWFTMIDQVVAERVFLDKNVGDGSIYCFSETHKEGSCGSALNAALQIRDEAVAHFDEIFHQRLEEFLSVTEELRGPAQSFFDGYKARTGIDFWQRKTKVRIGLVYGFVDEGLWGLSSQSHYDVQGDLVSLAVRVESKAKENEILMDEAFVKEAGSLLTPEMISPRLETLKGMGEVKLYAISTKKNLSLVA